MDPNSNKSSSAANDAASKRQALTGQWRTPPLPVFAGSQQPNVQYPHQQSIPQPLAEQQMAPAPDASIALPESTDDYAAALQEAYRRGAEAAAALQQQQMTNAVSCPNFHPNGVPADVMESPEQPPQEPMPMLVPNPLANMPPPQANPNNAARSFSLPDMASYAARAQAEEEKRKKRLARNRASARLRRLRKKNLVDSYEGEVGILELSLQKLKAHTWGAGQNHEHLLEALGMERGQQALSVEERQGLIQEILDQQRDQVELIREVQLEQQVLKEMVSNPDDDLLQELEGVLQLSQDQKESLKRATAGLEHEVHAMETLKGCLDAVQLDTGVEDISNQFMGILHPNQVSKFLLWTDSNAEAIDQLDYCHAGPPTMSPTFHFGMDEHGTSQLNLNTMEEDHGN